MLNEGVVVSQLAKRPTVPSQGGEEDVVASDDQCQLCLVVLLALPGRMRLVDVWPSKGCLSAEIP